MLHDNSKIIIIKEQIYIDHFIKKIIESPSLQVEIGVKGHALPLTSV